MDNIWCPWRMEFIEGKKEKREGDACIFCELGGAPPGEDNLVLARGRESYVVMNRYPYNNGHLLIVPYSHAAQLKDLPPSSYEEILQLMSESMEVLSRSFRAEGFNCGMNAGRVSGCGILDHVHWHVVPRWTGDTNFMPVLSDIRLMPEYLGETYRKLKGPFEKLGKGGQ